MGARSMVAQLASSKPGCAQSGAPFCHGESPGANFHGPGKVTAELPSMMVSAVSAGFETGEPLIGIGDDASYS
ncbi:MAG: hypothetical protein ACJ71S_00020 [Acidobacteriaceae bacterium]